MAHIASKFAKVSDVFDPNELPPDSGELQDELLELGTSCFTLIGLVKNTTVETARSVMSYYKSNLPTEAPTIKPEFPSPSK